MSVSMYQGQVDNRSKEIATLQGKAGAEREKAAKERQRASQIRNRITKTTSDSQRERKLSDASKAEEKAAKHEQKAADYDTQASRKSGSLNQARKNLERAQASEAKRDETNRKREDRERERVRRNELRELEQIEAKRRSVFEAPADFTPRSSEEILSAGRFLDLTENVPAPAASESESEIAEAAGNPSAEESEEVYDVCLSFAGEQRSTVELVASGLKERGYHVFYDDDQQAELWGKDLAEHFDWIYRKASRSCLMFISKEYAEKTWTRHERRSALARAVEQDEYVLPARFDETELDGLRPTIGYIDLREVAPQSLVELVAEKLGPPLQQSSSD